jgi:hypothetical protein
MTFDTSNLNLCSESQLNSLYKKIIAAAASNC